MHGVEGGEVESASDKKHYGSYGFEARVVACVGLGILTPIPT